MPRGRYAAQKLERGLDAEIAQLPTNPFARETLVGLTLQSQIAAFSLRQMQGCRLAKTTICQRYDHLIHWLKYMTAQGVVCAQEVDLAVMHGYIVFLQKQGHTASYISGKVIEVRDLFEFLYEFGVLPKHPFPELSCTHSSPNKAFQVFTPQELTQLIQTAVDECESKQDAWRYDITFKSVRGLCILVMMIGTGLRPCEIAAIKMSDVNLEEGYIHIEGKGNTQYFRRYRKVYIDSPLITSAMESWLHMRSAIIIPELFCSWDGFPLRPYTFYQLVMELGQKAGISQVVTPTLLRKTFCTHLSEQGSDPYTVAELMGHSDVEMALKCYTHFDTKQLHEHAVRYNPFQFASDSNTVANAPQKEAVHNEC